MQVGHPASLSGLCSVMSAVYGAACASMTAHACTHAHLLPMQQCSTTDACMSSQGRSPSTIAMPPGERANAEVSGSRPSHAASTSASRPSAGPVALPQASTAWHPPHVPS